MTILVTGARGSIGREVLAELLDADVPVRASSRDPQPGDFPQEVEVVRADLTDPATFGDLLDGVTKVFLYAHSEAVREFVTAAEAAGVEHVVLLSSNSVVFPDAERNPIAKFHLDVEAALRDSGMAWTFVRPGYLSTNTLRWTSIKAERVVRTAFPDGRTSNVHEKDVAGIAARALLDDGHEGQAYFALGAGPTTVREQIADISAALGEPVRVDVVDVDTFRAELRGSMPDAIIERLIAGRGDVPPVPEHYRHDAVADLLGRPPLTFAEWARDHAEDFR